MTSPPVSVFVDTSYFIALLNSQDADHARAVSLQQQFGHSRKVTSEYVLTELCDGLARLRFRSLAGQLVSLIRRDTSFHVVPSSNALFAAGLQLFLDRPDKEWGLTDCTSFVIMDQLGLTLALAADHHFIQAGYHALLREAS